jgi:hypothetical protein
MANIYALHDVLSPCQRCRCGRLLLAQTIFGQLCATCFGDMGEPRGVTPGDAPTLTQLEQEIRRRMLERGGSDRYRVIAGKT